MSARTEKIIPARRVEQVIVDFDAQSVAAPFMLRCGALLIDYMIVVLAPVALLMIARFMGGDGNKLLNGPLNSTGWLIATLLTVTNMVILPAIGGQSIGKAVTGIRIVAMDGTPAGFGHILRRNVIGYFVTLLTVFIGFIIAAFSSSGRALHDYIGGTVVIYGQKRPVRK